MKTNEAVVLIFSMSSCRVLHSRTAYSEWAYSEMCQTAGNTFIHLEDLYSTPSNN